MVTLKILAQFLNRINGYCRKRDDKHEILVTPLSGKYQKGLGPSVNISTMAWNFEVKIRYETLFQNCKLICQKLANSEGSVDKTVSFAME